MRITDEGVQASFSKFYDEKELNWLAELFEAEQGDLVLIISDKDKVVFHTLGFLRCELAEKLELTGEGAAERYEFLWVVDFPLFEEDDEGCISAKHHPFTSPVPEEVDLLETEPLSVHALAYDIVLNGNEIGGGSIRIHDRTLQRRMFDALGLSEAEVNNKFGFLLEAFRYGVPPHGGIAYGLDRLVMLLLGEESIRETIAFPKNQAAEDTVSGAPSEAGADQLAELGITLV